MTRAGDRLYVYGDRTPEKNFEESWYHLIRSGLEEHAKDKVTAIPVPAGIPQPPADPATPVDPAAATEPEPTILRLAVPQTAKPVPDNVRPVEKEHVVGTPVWARTIPPAGTGAIERFRPSSANKSNDNIKAPSPLNNKANDRYYADLGTAVHALLELLPMLPVGERENAAQEYLARPSLAIREDDQIQTLQQVSAVLNDPEFGVLFGPGSRPEVSISGFIEKNGKKQMLNALIDRLVVTDKTVLIIDYKNSLRVPKDASQVSEDYIVQLASYKMAVQQIYPDKEIKCALLYTREAKLIALPEDKMEEAIKEIDLKKYVPLKKQAGPKI